MYCHCCLNEIFEPIFVDFDDDGDGKLCVHEFEQLYFEIDDLLDPDTDCEETNEDDSTEDDSTEDE